MLQQCVAHSEGRTMTAREITCPECGSVFPVNSKHKRSSPQHRRFFAVCRAAYIHWPELDQDFRPRNEDHLRYWLTAEAGKFTVTKTVRFESVDPVKGYWVMRALLDNCEDDRMFLELDGDVLIQKRALSVAHDAMDQKEFNELQDAVEALLQERFGFSVEKLLIETERAA